MICIDSDFAIAVLKGDEKARKLLRFIEAEGAVSISALSVFEMTYITKGLSKKREEAMFGLLEALEVLPLDDRTALVASKLGRELTAKGKIIHPMDLMIGATALVNNMPLVTNNKKHFSRIKELEIINW
jgi:predicted nucleic acid-binding protein